MPKSKDLDDERGMDIPCRYLLDLCERWERLGKNWESMRKKADDYSTGGDVSHRCSIRHLVYQECADELRNVAMTQGRWSKSDELIRKAEADGWPKPPKCPACGSAANMMLHDDEWVCHSTHTIESNAKAQVIEAHEQD